MGSGSGLMLGFALLVCCFFLSSTVTGWVLGISLPPGESVADFLSTENGLNAYRVVQGLGNLLTWGLAAVLWSQMTGQGLKGLGIVPKFRLGYAFLTAMIVITIIPFAQLFLFNEDNFHLPEFLSGLESWIHSREKSSAVGLDHLLNEASNLGFVLNVVALALIPAIAEELFFRGFLLKNLLQGMSGHLAVWISALIFSFLHFQFYGFLPRMMLGALLGYAFWLSGSLLISITGHFVFNFVNILVAFISGPREEGASSSEIPIELSIFSLVVTIALLYIFFRSSKKLKTRLHHE